MDLGRATLYGMRNVYLDNAAATPTDPRVIRATSEVSRLAGHPSAFNDAGRHIQGLLEKARKEVADFLHARPDEIIFTSSDSESISLALAGFLRGKKGRVLTTPIEHPSVLKTLASLLDTEVDFIDLDKNGHVDLVDLKRKLKKDTLLVSVMYANNEIGTIQPISKIARLIRDFKIENLKLKIHEKSKTIFHVDACQATGFLDMNVQNLGADLLTFNGIKIYGPKGVGVLYKRRRVVLQPFIRGGIEEHGLRAGTENVPAIVGLAKALSLIKPTEGKKLSVLRDYAIAKIKKEIPGAILVGPEGNKRLPNNINVCVPKLTSENMLLELDKYGIYAGSGSACTSHSVEPSHVLKAIGIPKTHINGALRFSLGRGTKKSDIEYLARTLKKIIRELEQRYR